MKVVLIASFSSALGALCVFGLLSCGPHGKVKPVANKTAGHDRKIIEVQESKDLAESGAPSGASSWSSGTDIDVWYRDMGDQILVATRSSSLVVIHVDANRNGRIDGGQDRVYAVRPDGSVTSQYARPVWAAAAWGEAKTGASAMGRSRSGSSETAIWRLPKDELGSVQDGADLTFDLFDERYQMSQFRPGLPFEAVIRVKYSKAPAKSVTKQEAPKNPGSPTLIFSTGNPAKDRPGGKTTGPADGKKAADEAREAEERARLERERVRQQEADRQRQELAALKARQEQQQREIDEARRKLAEEQAQRDRERKARDESQPRVFRPDPVQVPVPKTEPPPYSGPNSGEIVWEGTIKGTELITIENGQASSGTLTGALPGVLCLLQPADPKRVSIASTPAPYNNYKRMVFRVSGNGRMRVVIKWSLP